MLMRNLSVLILTRNRLPMIQRLLSSALFWHGLQWWQTHWNPQVSNMLHKARVVVVDQASTDGTGDWAADKAARYAAQGLIPIDYIRAPHNLGCAGGRNALIEQAQLEMPDDIAVFLDDDIVPTSHLWLERLIAPILSAEADISGVEGRMIDGQGRTHPAADQLDYVSGGWMAVRNGVFMAGLRFDERFNPNYYEDVDFCKRAADKGARLTSVGEIGLLHTPDHGSSETLDGAASRKKFVEKWHGWLRGRQT